MSSQMSIQTMMDELQPKDTSNKISDSREKPKLSFVQLQSLHFLMQKCFP